MLSAVYFVLALCANVLAKIVPQCELHEGPLILMPYIENGEIEKAKHLSAVDPSEFAGVNSHAAYFTVNNTYKWHLFFCYFPAEGVPLDSTPLIIWLQGGPGSSSLYGLFEEIGPIQYKNGKVERMPITWGSNYSLLFIDNPVGTGFSFSEDSGRYAFDEDEVGACLLSFIQQFVQVFPELRTAPLFIAGESYAGKYIPAFGHYIHHYRNESMPINLKGLAIGDGWTDPPTLMHYSELALQLGLLDPEQAGDLHLEEEKARKHWNKNDFDAFKRSVDKVISKLKFQVNNYNYLEDDVNLGDFDIFLNRQDIQEALHTKIMHYTKSSSLVSFCLHEDFYHTVKPWLEELLEHYGVMCYNGQLDVLVGYALSVHTYRSLQWSGQQDYLNASRTLFFVRGSGNFLEAMVRSAGHMVPKDQPRAAKQLIDMFINKFK